MDQKAGVAYSAAVVTSAMAWIYLQTPASVYESRAKLSGRGFWLQIDIPHWPLDLFVLLK